MYIVELVGIGGTRILNKIYLLNLIKKNTCLNNQEIIQLIDNLINNSPVEIVLNIDDFRIANDFVVSLCEQNVLIGNTNFHEEN